MRQMTETDKQGSRAARGNVQAAREVYNLTSGSSSSRKPQERRPLPGAVQAGNGQARGAGQELQQLQKLASKLGQAGEQMEKEYLKKAAAAIGGSQKHLEQMASQPQELDSLDGALADLQEAAKNGMAGDQRNQPGDTSRT